MTLIERSHIGGLALNADLIENLIGFPDGISGKEFTELMRRQTEKWGVETLFSEVVNIEKRTDGFTTTPSDGKSLDSKFLIVATGTLPVEPPIDGLSRLLEEGKAFFEVYKVPEDWKEVLIIGGGDVAFDYAIGLAKRGRKVRIVFRSAPRTLKLLVERARSEGVALSKGGVEAVSTDGGRVSVRTESDEFSADGLLIATGRRPNDRLLMRFGELVVDERSCHSDIDGLYICGSLRRPSSQRHIVIAAADGLSAASHIIERSNYGRTAR